MRWFDTTVALPERAPDDLYTRHQSVWRFMAPAMPAGGLFLFHCDRRARGDLLMVRSPTKLMVSRTSQLPRSGRFEISLMAGRRTGQSAPRPLRDDEARPWLLEMMRAHGFSVSVESISPSHNEIGMKGDMRIVIPVRSFAGCYQVENAEKAWEGFTQGIGRAKRFGCGMMRIARS